MLPESEYPELIQKDGAKLDNKKLGHLRGVVQSRAIELSVAPELLTKRRHLEKLLRSVDHAGRYQLPKELLGWRENAIGNNLLEALHA